MTVGTLTPTNRTHDGSRDTQTPGYRIINGKRIRVNQAIGSFFCRYGWASAGNYGCGHLTSKNAVGAMPSPVGTTMYLEADSGDVLSTPGDSGGPVFTGSTALGIMHACVGTLAQCQDPNFPTDLLYIAIDFVESGISATLLTVP